MPIEPEVALRSFTLHLTASGYRRSTIDGYHHVVSRYLRLQNGTAFSRESVLSFLADTAATCSRPTLLAYWKALKCFFDWAEVEVMGENPMRGLRRPRLSRDEAERNTPVYTEADRDALLQACPEWTRMGLRNRALILTLWHTPLRASEICGLTVSDLDWAAMEITVRSGKGGVRYSAIMPTVLAHAIDRYLRHRAIGSENLWVDRAGAPLSPHGLALMLRRVAARARLQKPVYPHAFRHRYRIWLVTLGLTDVEIAALMGHRTVRSTWGYGRKAIESGAKARLRSLLP